MYSSMQSRLLWSFARPCRFVARRRFPASFVSSRRFHTSRRWLSATPHDPHGAADPPPGGIAHDISTAKAGENLENEASSPSAITPPAEQPVKKEQTPYGSGVRRAMRNRKPAKEWTTPAATIPKWFYERNTMVNDSSHQLSQQSVQQVRIERSESEADKTSNEQLASGGDGGDHSGSSSQPDSENRYAVVEAIWDELRASVKAGLNLPPAKYANEPSASKSHLVLQYPGNDGILFLDAVVKRLSHELGADLVTINAQDIAELCSEQDLADSGMTSPIRFLGYEVYRPPPSFSWQDFEDNVNEGEGDESDMVDAAGPMRGGRPDQMTPKFIAIESSRVGADNPISNLFGLKNIFATLNGLPNQSSGFSAARSAGKADHRWLRLINELISSSSKVPKELTAEEEPSNPEASSEQQKPAQPRDIIVQVQDYRDIQMTQEGSKFLSWLHQAIEDRRKAGSRVLLVGTMAQDVVPSASPNDIGLMQGGGDDQFSKTLVITPCMESRVADKIFTEDRTRRTKEINIRHLQEMLRTRLSEQSSAVKDNIFEDRDWPLDAQTVEESGLTEGYWTYDRVHRVATLALGCVEAGEAFGFEHLQRGIHLMEKTDRIKNEWLKEKAPKASVSENGNDRERLLKSLRKTCNTHEKKLLNGVVDAKSIRTTFADVHVPSETIDALKTLTSLSLIRPEAFTYGVLATDKIPGLLLYGPPGTGKTLLAKAVARESGATVLEVSGSEVYDMYVGEGEKNVKAIFTLAKKLSPCVVFIDEADAIFCSRTGASSRTSHRELINQFLREWDGMNDLSAFIMVATNRPFDLDDAVLRRLPRRLLVDLPTEQDRLAILKIHLKDETLDASVDLTELARRTPLYSGSDLKNLSVAAALACVREENDKAAQHQGDEPYTYPERRTLTWAHFERGMEEISASISEDMSSLSAIRKFDETYGDRKGRRKKGPGWGFMPAAVEASTQDSARVRT